MDATVLPAKEMLSNGFLDEVAFTLSKFHQLKPSSERIIKKSLIQRILLDDKDNILTLIHKKMMRNIYTPEEQKLIEIFKKWVSIEELNFIERVTKLHEEGELAFSHNDLLANNILIDKAKNSIVFIDYEYSSYNYPIFDIANYICESEFNYDVNEPPYFQVTPIKADDFHKQVRFIQAYVVSKNLSLS